MMLDEINVREVIEKNDCSGRKHLFVTAMEDDEIVRSRFRLTRVYMFPHDKLVLSSVAPLDKVRVVHDCFDSDLSLAGEFTEILSDFHTREPICRCNTHLVSDGFDVFCPNPMCGLTLAARFERLANTFFTDPETTYFDTERDQHRTSAIINEDQSYYRPFHLIKEGLFWGFPGGSLEHVLLTKLHQLDHVSLATFLVEPLFEDFIQRLHQRFGNDQFRLFDIRDNQSYYNIRRFYGEMEELVQRRDHESDRQNILMYKFLTCLGLETLTHNIILGMMAAERNLGAEVEPMLVYAYLLTHPVDLANELNLHPLEATNIVREAKSRSYELCDIFAHYTNQSMDVIEAFGHTS